jgi:hypothetical protein
MSAYTFVSGEHTITTRDLVEFQVLVAGPLYNPDPSVVRVFESDDDFLLWARTSEQADELLAAHAASLDARDTHAHGDHRELRERQRQKVEEATADLKRIAKQAGLALNSPDLFARLGERWNQDPVLVFEHVDLGGDSAFLPAGPLGWPDFTWLRSAAGTWNDLASSGVALGGGFLSEHVWFGGRKFWFGGVPFWSWNLTDFGFNDMASSAWLL